MKRIIVVLLLAISAAVLLYAGNFYWRNLRGSAPALRASSRNIVVDLPAIGRSFLPAGQGPLSLPRGFSISIFANDLSGARVMILDRGGNMLVSRPWAGVVTKLFIRDGRVVDRKDILRGLRRPHGLAFDPQDQSILYVAEEDKISRAALNSDGAARKIIDLPAGGRHTTRTLLFGNDGRLYVSIGSSCNACVEKDKRRAAIYSLRKDGSDFRLYASGLRNSVFMVLQPGTSEIWATDMGRDYLGDDLPPDEVNIIRFERNYGWPFCYGKKILDEEFDSSSEAARTCNKSEPSYLDIPARSAPLGLAFIPAEGWPAEYRYNLLVALHGSWNRSIPTGYKVVRFKLDERGRYLDTDESGAPRMLDFITGWLTAGDRSLGRPVDLLALPGGKLYISDDKAGVIYLVTYAGEEGR
ncbi:MAG: PQQ-dependent sugar dehydrogenase [Smithellaceae bacterium]|nr:PQQ-dependent sugar dehydrogenase [Smithellaceae bacterium]